MGFSGVDGVGCEGVPLALDLGGLTGAGGDEGANVTAFPKGFTATNPTFPVPIVKFSASVIVTVCVWQAIAPTGVGVDQKSTSQNNAMIACGITSQFTKQQLIAMGIQTLSQNKS